MKVTFPHMGNAYIPIKALLDDLEVDIVIPPLCNNRTLEIGTKISPEQACLPLKINLGNYIESMQYGADTVLITGSCGPCRFGYYGVAAKEILEDQGYDMDFIILDPPDGKYKDFFKRIKRIAGGKPWSQIASSFGKSVDVAVKADELERKVFYTRPRETHRGDTDRIYSEYRQEIMKAHGPKEIKKVILYYRNKLDAIALDSKINPLKIGIIGEIYTIIEPFVNLNIEQKLGYMGIEVDRSIMVSTWVKDNLIYKALGKTLEKKTHLAASPYLDRCIGGHAWECIGNAVQYQKKNYDGAIQVYPFGCMPEIVAESILPTIEKDLSFPIMTLIVDELTGEAGYCTRLEAFVDLLHYHRKRRMNDERVLSWS